MTIAAAGANRSAGELLRRMREISGDYAVPDGACPSYRALYFGLAELEKDLHRHIHLENNVLFPQAVELERKVFGDDAQQQQQTVRDEDFACRQVGR